LAPTKSAATIASASSISPISVSDPIHPLILWNVSHPLRDVASLRSLTQPSVSSAHSIGTSLWFTVAFRCLELRPSVCSCT
jgi:hypothetical protein